MAARSMIERFLTPARSEDAGDAVAWPEPHVFRPDRQAWRKHVRQQAQAAVTGGEPAPGDAALQYLNGEGEWPLDIFGYTKGADVEGGNPDFDLTGRARFLVHGPYLFMPAGLWRFTAEFLVDPQGDAAYLRFDITNSDQENVLLERFDEPGRYEVELTGEVIQPRAVEWRVLTARPHFQGRFRLLKVMAYRLAEQAPVAA